MRMRAGRRARARAPRHWVIRAWMHAAPRGAARGARARAVADGRRAEVDPRPSGRRSRHMWVSGASLASGRQLQLV